MVGSVVKWLYTPKLLSDLNFFICFHVAWWDKEFLFHQRFAWWMKELASENVQHVDKVVGHRVGEMPRRVVKALRQLNALNPETDVAFKAYKDGLDQLTLSEQAQSRNQVNSFLNNAAVAFVKNFKYWLVAFPDSAMDDVPELAGHVAARLYAIYKDEPPPDIVPSLSFVDEDGDVVLVKGMVDDITKFATADSLRATGMIFREEARVDVVTDWAAFEFSTEASAMRNSGMLSLITVILRPIFTTTHSCERGVGAFGILFNNNRSQKNDLALNAIQYGRHNLTNVERKVAAITEDKSARSESGQRSDLRTKPVFEGRLKLLDERLKKRDEKFYRDAMERHEMNVAAKIDQGSILDAARERAEETAQLAGNKKQRMTVDDAIAAGKTTVPAYPQSVSGILNISPAGLKSADTFGALLRKDVFLAECEAREIQLPRTKDGTLKSTVTIADMTQKLREFNATAHPDKPFELLRMSTLDNSKPDPRFPLTNRLFVPLPGASQVLPVAASTVNNSAGDEEGSGE